MGSKYAINFNIFYETTPGEEIYVIGSIKELGMWKRLELKLFWNEGHIWRNKEPLLVNHDHFEYKYVKTDEGIDVSKGIDGFKSTFETGVNRIADL